MRISQTRCIGCGNCTDVCPMGAIYVNPETRKATIDDDSCVECYACYNGLSREVLPPKTARVARRWASSCSCASNPIRTSARPPRSNPMSWNGPASCAVPFPIRACPMNPPASSAAARRR